jgi:hypothetical protein
MWICFSTASLLKYTVRWLINVQLNYVCVKWCWTPLKQHHSLRCVLAFNELTQFTKQTTLHLFYLTNAMSLFVSVATFKWTTQCRVPQFYLGYGEWKENYAKEIRINFCFRVNIRLPFFSFYGCHFLGLKPRRKISLWNTSSRNFMIIAQYKITSCFSLIGYVSKLCNCAVRP